MGVYDGLGIEPIINAAGSVTRLGGAPVSPEVWDAYREASQQWVPLDQLQAAASRVISRITHAEAGLVTSGAAASLTLGAAAILARGDLARMERLPDTAEFPNEFIVAREHRSGYDHAVRAAGARFVEVGFDEARMGAGGRRVELWEYEAAIGERTAGVFYALQATSRPPLGDLVTLAHRHNLPVLVDAAAQLPPRSNLRLASETGADLVGYSGGKAIRGPQSTGILCGKRALVQSAALQMLDMDEPFELWEPVAPLLECDQFVGLPRHGIARGMKVSKEEIVALVTALTLFNNGDYDADLERQRMCLDRIVDALRESTLQCRISASSNGELTPTLALETDATCPLTAFEICRRLRANSPPIYVGHTQLDDGLLVINPLCLTLGDADQIADCLLKILQEGAAQ